MASERFQYFEVQDKLLAQGGVCKGRFLPSQTQRRRNVNGDDALQVSLPRTNRCVPYIAKGGVFREINSLDGTRWREWVVDQYQLGSGAEPLVVVTLFPVLHLLVNYPINQVDADGYVYQGAAAVQLGITPIVQNYLCSRTPPWIVPGTLDPTGLFDIPFSPGDSALSGGRRCEEITGKELSLTPIGTTQYGLNLTTIGAGAAPLYIRAGKQLQRFLTKVVPGTITRAEPIVGTDGDEAGVSAIAWAYWEVEATATTPNRVKLKAEHGGDPPIAFDDQFNHANLPGGANSLYLETRAGTYTQIIGSSATTQELTVASLTNISVGDRVRIVASSTGKHLTFLDAPLSLAAYGVLSGEFRTAFDDTMTVNKNALMQAWAGAQPDGWTGGVGTKTTVQGEYVTAGQALKVATTISAGQVICATPVAQWFITSRKTFFCVTALVRITADSNNLGVGLRLKVGSTVIGQPIYFRSPRNSWNQLKISGLDLSAYVGTTVSLTAELFGGNQQSDVFSSSMTLFVDNICITPTLTPRAPCAGSNGARVWQEVNRWLADVSSLQLAYELDAADLEQLGVSGQVEVVLGQTVHIFPDDTNLPTEVVARLLQIEDAVENPGIAKYTIGVLPPRASRKQVAPPELVIPFFEPIPVTVASEDNKAAALRCLVKTPLNETSTQVEINLDVQDSKGGSPSVTAVAIGGATIASGSGAGPWYINKPSAGSGRGRVIFTAKLAGRADATDAVDIPEQIGNPQLAVHVYRVSETAGQSVYRLWASDGIGGVTVTLTYDAGGLTVSPASGQTFTSIASATGTPTSGQYVDLTITRPTFGMGMRTVGVVCTAPGRDPGTDSISVPEQQRDTIALSAKITRLTTNPSTMVYRCHVIDPFPPGGATVTQTYESDLAVTEANNRTMTPTASFETTGYLDWTIARPSAGSPVGRFTLRVTDTANGRIAASDSVDLPPQDPPQLSVTDERVSDTQWKITWSATGTVEVSKNGGAWGSPPITSGIAFARPDADQDSYAFRVTNGGQTIPGPTISVPARIYAPSVTVIAALYHSGSSVDARWNVSGMPASGVTYNVYYDAYTSSNARTGASGAATGQSASPVNFSPSPSANSTDKWRVRVDALYQGNVIASDERYATMVT